MPPKQKVKTEKVKTEKVKTEEQKERERIKEETKRLREEAKRLREETKRLKEETKKKKLDEKNAKEEDERVKREEEEEERRRIIEEHRERNMRKREYKIGLRILEEREIPIRKIIHIGDIHIRLAERHKEYNRVFDEFYKCLKRIKESEPNSLVCLCGDLLEKKDNLKPDTIIHTWNFLKNISDIFPLIIIAGNHDVIETNIDKTDSISAILKDRPMSNIYYLRDT